MTRYAIAALAVGLMMVGGAQAGKYNKKLNIGDNAPAFSGLKATDGKEYSLDSFKDKDVVVVCVTCNHCPVAVAYEDRIIEFNKKHAGPNSKVGFIAINVNNNDQDKLDKMVLRAKEKGFNFTYAYDPSQKIGRDLGASVTPEFFVFDKGRNLVYMGAMDDSSNPGSAKTNYLEQAVEATLKGDKPSTAETRARGCGVQYERK